MNIKVDRLYKRDTYTVGKMYLNGKYFCDTIEDKVRNIEKEGKVYGKTAIPAGRYQIVYTYSNHFKRNMPRLLNVPYFDGILIHSGNSAEDSLGCIIVGENKVKGKVINSRPYSSKLNLLIEAATSRKEQITITIC